MSDTLTREEAKKELSKAVADIVKKMNPEDVPSVLGSLAKVIQPQAFIPCEGCDCKTKCGE